MIARFRAWLVWWRSVRAVAATLDQLVRDDDPLLAVTSLDPTLVGRQASQAEAITETVAWLEASGWRGDRGRLQCYALWLLEMRDRYERVTVS